MRVNSGLLVTHHPGFAISAQVLARIETETSHVAHAPGASSFVFGAVGLGCIFDHDEAPPLGDRQNRVHVSHLPIEVDGNDGFGALRDRGLDLRHIHRERTLIDIDEHCRGSCVLDRRDRRHESKGHGDYFVARTDSGCEQRKVQCAGAAVHSDALLGLTICSELRLERAYFRSQGELTAVKHALDGGVDFVLDADVLRLQIYKRDHRSLH